MAALSKMKIVSIVGARPQFIKLAPLIRAIQKHNKSNSKFELEHLLVHTGQHYDYEMNKIFFDDLGITEPHFNLEVGSGTHGWQTGETIKRVEKVLIKEKPSWTLVYGDTNSTLAGTLAASKLHIPIAHIEAGLRSFNKEMPEEINRVLTDYCSDILFCPTETAVRNLKNEGFKNILNNGKLINLSSTKFLVKSHKLPIVINVGDIMYDLLLIGQEIAEKKSSVLEKLKLKPKKYNLATIHRAENTADKDRLKNIIEAFIEISKEKLVIFPVHPRTKKTIETFNLSFSNSNKVYLIDPVSYFDMLILEKNANRILTDSGGVQKEAYILGTPCITLRDETEWLETVESGWNVVAGTKKESILKHYFKNHFKKNKRSSFYGEGQTSTIIIEILARISSL